jgi:DNA primase
MIPDAIVDEVRARADIVDIIGEQIQLKRSGKDFKALCPFHNEKTPSFYVVPSKGIYKCFGCGEGGDVFTFLMKRGGLTFLEAVRQIGGRVGVDVPAFDTTRQTEEPHRALYEAVAFAADHFRQQLWEEEAGEAGRRYLEGRGITREAAERFGIGYAPAEWRLLRERAHVHGLTDDVLLDAGLIKASDQADEPYDRFRERLIFPIAEVGGRIVAFGGRAAGRAAEGVPKYLNSPETPIYHKGGTLYGLNWSKGAIRREGSALVVEGYMDYVSLAANGVAHVVAGMGTALTGDQANLVARYTGKVHLLYDSDIAGLRATFKSGDALLRVGVHPLVVTLPGGEDPDSLMRKGGTAALRPLLDNAVDVLERKLQMLEERGFFEGIEGARNALDRLLPTLRATLDPTLRDIYVNRVAQRTGVRAETLEQELARGEHEYGHGAAALRPRASSARERWRGADERGAGTAKRPAPGKDAHAAERLLLLLMLRDPSWITVAAAEVAPEDMREPANHELFTALTADRETGGAVPADLGLSAAAALRRGELEADPVEITDGDRSFRDAVADLQVRRLFLQLDELDLRTSRAADEETGVLMLERQAIHKQLRVLGADYKISRRYRWQASGAARRPHGLPTEDE